MRYDLKSFVELTFNKTDVVAEKAFNYIEKNVGIEEKSVPWIFLDINAVLKEVPEVLDLFRLYKLKPRSCACTILYKDLGLHMDTPPVIAKINFPIANTEGWSNRWYYSNKLELLENKKDRLGFENINTDSLTPDDLTLIAEHSNFKQPIVLNSLQLHNVEKLVASKTPRIMLTFTFFNDPWELLKK